MVHFLQSSLIDFEKFSIGQFFHYSIVHIAFDGFSFVEILADQGQQMDSLEDLIVIKKEA
jgi:hypothetical protein